MENKIKILFVIESLTLAGSEKSLIALLSNLDSDLYEINLQLFRYGGELENFIPNFVKLLPPLAYNEFAGKSLFKNLKSRKFRYLRSKMTYTISLRMKNGNVSDIAKLYWKSVQNAFTIEDREYDIAIAYAQGAPTYYVMDKIKARKKITWVNANVQFTKHNLLFEKGYYSQYDKIVAVSEINQQHFTNIFPDLAEKLWLIPDMLDFSSIYRMADLYCPKFEKNKFNILTVSRLEKGMKGLDITLETCRILRDKGVDFHWYILGKGSFQTEIQNFIKSHNLEGYLTLLGTSTNPYPYFKAADLYVQTSRSESYGISIAEARLLNTPIVTTRFDTVYMQMVEGKNGLVTDMNPEGIADGIIKIMNNKDLYNSIVEYLKQEPKENTETVKRFDAMIGNLLITD
ncbi:MAG: glycosyltransferase [Bacteroidota bacterium]